MGNPFVHSELATTDIDRAKSFYGQLFDWQFSDVDMGGGFTYTMIGVGDGTGGGMLKHPVPGAPSAWLPYVLVETAALLLSSITYGFAMIAGHKGNKSAVLGWLAVTFACGAAFIGLEINEFHHLIAEGHGPQTSAFLSAFFGLVGLHGLHVTAGLIWMAVMMLEVAKTGLTGRAMTRLNCLSLFWHFLDIVWICVFTVVYLKGAM